MLHSSSLSIGSEIPPQPIDNCCFCQLFPLFYRFQVIAESLWDQLKEDTTQFHQRIVELFLQLHNLTASPSLCANVIGNSLIDISKVNTIITNFIWVERYVIIFQRFRDIYAVLRVALDC